MKKVFPMGYLFWPTAPTLSQAPKSMPYNKRRPMHFENSDGQGPHGIKEAYRSEFKRGFLSVNVERAEDKGRCVALSHLIKDLRNGWGGDPCRCDDYL